MSEIIQSIPLSKIRTEGLQVRAETNRAHVDDLAELFGDEGVWPEALPPCIVFFDTASYWLADGHHRYQGAQEAGCTEIPCEVRRGGKIDALWFAIGANHTHGLRRTSEDKRRAVMLAYQLDSNLSDREIARRANVSPGLANYVLRDVRGQSSPLSNLDSGDTPFDAEPSAPLSKLDSGTSTHAKPAAPASPAESAPDVRVDARGRKMDVSRIGKGRKPAAPSPATADAPRGVDGAGLTIREASAAAMASIAVFDEIEQHLKVAARLIDRLGKSPGGEMLRAHYLQLKCETRDGQAIEHLRSHDLENLRRELKHWRPYAARCPRCGDSPSQQCKVCCGLPYVIEDNYKRSGKRADAPAAAR